METYDLKSIIESVKAPPEITNYWPTQDVLFHMKGKNPQRNIFKHQKFTEKELEKLRRLKLEITKHKVVLPPTWDDSELLKFVYGANFKTRGAISALKSTLQSRNEVFPSDFLLIYPKIYEILVRPT